MEHIITEEFIRTLLGEASTEIQEFRKTHSFSYQAHRNSYLHWIDHMRTLDGWIQDQYTNTVSEAFLDYETPIEDYFYIQGILAAVGSLSGQSVKLDDLECVPGLKDRKEALDQISRDFLGKLPPEERDECARQFAEKVAHIHDSRKYFFLHGFELMFTLLKQTGHEMSDEQLIKLYKIVQSEL